MTFYVYDEKNKFYGIFTGKEVMSTINLHSWNRIRDIMVDNKGWYKTFYIYDKYGNYIETLNTIKEVKEKYKVPASKIKNIERGNRYFGD